MFEECPLRSVGSLKGGCLKANIRTNPCTRAFVAFGVANIPGAGGPFERRKGQHKTAVLLVDVPCVLRDGTLLSGSAPFSTGRVRSCLQACKTLEGTNESHEWPVVLQQRLKKDTFVGRIITGRLISANEISDAELSLPDCLSNNFHMNDSQLYVRAWRDGHRDMAIASLSPYVFPQTCLNWGNAS